MKPVIVKYRRLRNLGNYENETVEVEVEVEEGETAQQALDAAKRFVLRNTPDPDAGWKLESARKVIAAPDHYAEGTVADARRTVAEAELVAADGPEL